MRKKAEDPWLLPADQTRRVILCSGQIFYALSRARRSRQIRDIILVRLEQIAPFPHDLVTQVPPASQLHPTTCQGNPHLLLRGALCATLHLYVSSVHHPRAGLSGIALNPCAVCCQVATACLLAAVIVSAMLSSVVTAKNC